MYRCRATLSCEDCLFVCLSVSPPVCLSGLSVCLPASPVVTITIEADQEIGVRFTRGRHELHPHPHLHGRLQLRGIELVIKVPCQNRQSHLLRVCMPTKCLNHNRTPILPTLTRTPSRFTVTGREDTTPAARISSGVKLKRILMGSPLPSGSTVDGSRSSS